MLWWDDLMKNVVAMNSNNYTQEGQVEGQVVNDQNVNDQNVGSQKGNQKNGGFKGRYKERIRVEDKQLELRENPDDKEPKFKAYVGEGKFVSQYVRTRINHGHVDEELDNVTSNEDLQKIVDRLKEEKKESDKKKGKTNKYSKKSVDELLLDLADNLEALEEKTGKSPEELYKDAQEVVDKRELERIDKEEEEAREAKARRDARREAILSKAKQSNNQPNQ